MFHLFFQSVLVGEVLISTVNVTPSGSLIYLPLTAWSSLFFFFLLPLSASELDVLLGIRSSHCLSTEVYPIARTVSDAGYYLKCLMCLRHGNKISVIFKACLRNVLSKLDSHSTWGKCLLFIVWLSAKWLCKAVLGIQLASLLFFVDHWPTLPLLPRLL